MINYTKMRKKGPTVLLFCINMTKMHFTTFIMMEQREVHRNLITYMSRTLWQEEYFTPTFNKEKLAGN